MQTISENNYANRCIWLGDDLYYISEDLPNRFPSLGKSFIGEAARASIELASHPRAEEFKPLWENDLSGEEMIISSSELIKAIFNTSKLNSILRGIKSSKNEQLSTRPSRWNCD
jgi:hypothetical protein